MVMAVGFGFGPDDDEDVVAGDDAADLGCPDPEDLHDPAEVVPPAALLLAADPTQLPGQWVDHGMSAWFAHTNQAALALARWMLETSRAQPGTRERVTHRRRAGKVIAASLGWSEAHAARRLEFARQLLERLPALGDAMDSGVLEEHKAWLFTSTLAELDTRQARTVVDDVLPDAPRLAYGVLRERIEKAAHDTDPGWAEARRAAAIARRRVSFRVAPSGAAELCGLDLPEEPAQDAHDRIVALARHITRELRAAGHDAPVGPIQSEVMLTLTGPTGAGMWDRDVIDHVIDRFTTPDNPDDGEGPADTGPDNPDGDGPDEDGGPADPGPHEPDEPDDEGPDDEGPEDRDDLDDGGSDDDGPEGSGPEDGDGDGDGDGDVLGNDAPAEDHGSAEDDVPGEPTTRPTAAAEKPPWRVPFVPRVALRVGLRTVLGLDRRAGQLPRHGVVTNSVATAMAWNRTHSTFRLLLYNPDGALEHALTVHPPRRGQPPPHARQRRHHIVELMAYTHELDALAAAAADPQLAFDGDPPPGGILLRGDALGLLRRAARALAAARARPLEEHPAHTQAEVGNRFPSTALRNWVQARDQTCRSPGCAADASTCDIDHTLPITEGGVTRADDLGACCRRDHTFKHHPDSGWTVTQTTAGRFAWTAPTGRLHIKQPERYTPGPDPVPRSDDDHTELPGLTLDPLPPPVHPPGSPRRNKRGYLTQAAVDTAAHLRQRARDRAGNRNDDPDTTPDDRFPEEPPF